MLLQYSVRSSISRFIIRSTLHTGASESLPLHLPNSSDADRAAPSRSKKTKGLFFIDSVFPIQLGTWDIRHYVALLRERSICQSIQDIAKDIHVPGYEFSKVDPRTKDGGVFIEFCFNPELALGSHSHSRATLDSSFDAIHRDILELFHSHGGVPSVMSFRTGRLWRVIGTPWQEDMKKYASRTLRIEFDGPDLRDQQLWEILRPFGRIEYIEPATPVPAGSFRFSRVVYQKISSAVIAHNCIHNTIIPSLSNPQTRTRLYTVYERPIKAHVIRDWLVAHPRIIFPVLFFLLGTLTYTVFDPVRAFAVESKLLGWFDYRKNFFVRWPKMQSFYKFIEPATTESRHINASAWNDRKNAEASLQSYLSDEPTTLTFLHGPAGSGKTMLLESVFDKTQRHIMTIDCSKIYDATSDAGMMKSLAKQTGYRPIFTFLDSFKNLIDIASVGLIGQKAGLSSSLQEQVKAVLDVVEQGLRQAIVYEEQKSKKEDEKKTRGRSLKQADRLAKIQSGYFHDGRIDCVAGNGIISELGVGVERLDESHELFPHPVDGVKRRIDTERKEHKNMRSIEAIPVVIIKHYDPGCQGSEAIITTALANWAGRLVSNKIAHVIVTSDDRDATKLSRAVPTRPLNDVVLSDADETSSLSYLKQSLNDLGMSHDFNSEEVRTLQRLGGRVRDLETVAHKLGTSQGTTVGEVVEDIIRRGATEVKKIVFGNELGEGKNPVWTRQQAWSIVKVLAKKDQINYYDVLTNFPFKGNEAALRALEQTELISIITADSQPTSVCAGKPVNRYVFQRLVSDRMFHAVQEIAYNDELISVAEAAIKSVESELALLKSLNGAESGVKQRARYLAEKLEVATQKITRLERENDSLKRLFVQSDTNDQKKTNWFNY